MHRRKKKRSRNCATACALPKMHLTKYIYIIPQQKTKTGTSANHRASQVSVCLDSQIARAKIN